MLGFGRFTLAHSRRREPQLRRPHRRAARSAAPRRSSARARSRGSRTAIHARHRRRRETPLRQGRRRHPRRPGARASWPTRATTERRVLGAFGYTRERDGAPHRRLAPAALAPRAIRLELPLRRLRRARRQADDHVLAEPAPAARADEEYCVTLNRPDEIDPERVIARMTYDHPLYTLESIRAQPALRGLSGAAPHVLRGRPPRQRLSRGRSRVGRPGCGGARGGVVRSALYVGTLMHARREPARNVFKYPVRYWLVDLDELPELERRLRLVSWNAPERRHLPRRRPFRGRRAADQGEGAPLRSRARGRAPERLPGSRC